MKIGIMGGTFDPIHLAHLIAGECAREGAALDEVWFMPTSVPPHKERPEGGAEAKERWEMLLLALDGCDRFRPIDLELTRGGTSYSIDTVTELRKRYPNHEFQYIIGGDMVQYLPQWHRIDELLLLIRFIGLERPGTLIDWSLLTPAMREAVTMIPMRQLDISSTDIRMRRKQGRSIRYLVPEAVRIYMEEGKLYE